MPDDNKIEIKKEEYERLVIMNQELSDKVSKLEYSISYRLGNALVKSARSWRDFIKLPVRVYRIFVEGIQRRKIRNAKRRTVNTGHKIKPSIKSKHPLDKKNINELQRLFESKTKDRKLKVAGVMDEFTESSFSPECELLQLTKSSCIDELNEFRPDFLFIESAWQGKDKSWNSVISNCKKEIVKCIDWCYENNVQTIFWNKEDPVHFSSFLEVASHVDYIFTTDVDCIPKYKQALGHERVYLLPFAAQPLYHNPIEKYDRKDAFNFAGSYYLRYPQRQADFNELVEAAKEFKTVEIYDRNFDNDHPHYKFPEEYEDLIIGSLPFSKIDKAYKGYRYGINMNTIKQSQSMFARRVFELLASNTVVISNYSRGVRAFFGDLVISSDKKNTILNLLDKFCKDETIYKKYRLLGMRKVLSQHTYSHRLSFIASKLSGGEYFYTEPKVNVFSIVKNKFELEIILDNYKRQKHTNKHLHILIDSKSRLPLSDSMESVSHYYNETEIKEAYDKMLRNEYVSIMSKNNYYGEFYLTDMVLAKKYCKTPVITKQTFFTVSNNEVIKQNPGKEYTYVSQYRPDRSLVIKEYFGDDILKLLQEQSSILETEAFSIDCFNFCENYEFLEDKSKINTVDDLSIKNQGIVFANISKLFGNELFKEYKPKSSYKNIKVLTSSEIYSCLPKMVASIRIKLEAGKLSLYSRLATNEHRYLYLDHLFKREEINLLYNSKFAFDSYGRLESIKSVFEFYDIDENKISHQMNEINGGGHSLAIPNNCEFVKLGFRVQGLGKFSIRKLSIGDSVNIPSVIFGTSNILSLSKQYPSYEDIYKYGFVHSRIKGYKSLDVNVDVFRLNNEGLTPFREFEGIDIAQGDLELLDRTLATGQYQHVLVHLLDKNMWDVLKKHIDRVKVTVWAHGAEIQLWERRAFEFESFSNSEITRQKNLSKRRKEFWEDVLNEPHQNFKMVFVSNYFKNEVQNDFNVEIPNEQTEIIHNYINSQAFNYVEKDPEQRKMILSIRPYASRKYANDLTVKAILELSKREFFNELTFCLVGDGILFDELTAPLKGFSNVIIKKQFLTHDEISILHKQYGVFLTPTRMDSQGVSRDEAMSSGLVPITSNVAAIPEFVDDSCGFLVEGEDYLGLADAIEKLYRNETLFIEMSRNASQRVRRQSSFKATIEKEITLFSKEVDTDIHG